MIHCRVQALLETSAENVKAKRNTAPKMQSALGASTTWCIVSAFLALLALFGVFALALT